MYNKRQKIGLFTLLMDEITENKYLNEQKTFKKSKL